MIYKSVFDKSKIKDNKEYKVRSKIKWLTIYTFWLTAFVAETAMAGENLDYTDMDHYGPSELR